MTRELFGTDGIRGVPGCFPLDDATVYAVGLALGELVGRRGDGAEPRVLIGRDTRESGPHLALRLAAGLRAAGVVPVSAGVLPTPGVAALVRAKGFAAGAVISASHNPFTDNGIKVFSERGTKFPDETEERLEAEIARHRRAPATGAAALDTDPALAAEYLDLLRARAGAKLDGLSVVLDCANGAASGLAPELFVSLGARVTAINAAPDGRNINAGCGSLHPQGMSRAVVGCGAAFGAAFDGDADRAIFAAASGKLVDGDGVLYMAARALRASGKLAGNLVVGTTMTNLGLERALAGEGIGLVRVPVGDRYVLEELVRRGGNLGGEPSGHVIFLDDSPAGDGLATALKVAEWVARQGPLENLVAGLACYPQKIVNVRVRSKPPLDSLPAVAHAAREARSALGDRGRIVLRYSGTESLARVMVEAEREEDVERWSGTIARAIEETLGRQSGH
ncbi:MAG TPA: phosphoglucosamine mutase [Candidatus Acidoferrales bacterium]|nr:phosphoglucosamine mutase [Candidatus Acidoferrales bacterium]